ncbi:MULTISPECIES: response regulator [Sphingomonas]|uniref:response regulator n=1 Tax=Sphingomonas TaxID=13687 RepID=UPI000DEFAB1C|nr:MULTISPECIES: response regulator [Sphingomonas]
MNRHKIVVVDDEPAIRRLLRAALERDGHHVIEVGTGRDLISALAIDRPDAVLLDLGLPDRDGLELVPLVLQADAALLIVSAREETEEKVAALDLGADDYVTKPFDTDEVLARLRRALRQRLGSGGSAPLVVEGLEIDLLNRRVRRNGAEVHLTPREYSLLAELARHPGRVITHSQLLRTIWGPAHAHNVEYLRVTARGLRMKIEVDPGRPSIVRTEAGVGYRLAEGR